MPFEQIIAPFFMLCIHLRSFALIDIHRQNYIIFYMQSLSAAVISAVMQYYFSKERMNYYEIHDW